MFSNSRKPRAGALLALVIILLWAGRPAAAAETLTDVANSIGADTFYNQGYTGTRSTLGIIDAGETWTSHAALTGQVLNPTVWALPKTGGGTATVQDHATEVGGVMVASNNATTGPGIAYGSKLWTGQIASSFGAGGSFSITGNSLLYPLMVFGKIGINSSGVVGGSGAITTDVINSSWGASDDTGNTVINALYDYLALQGVTMVCAAGNSGQGNGKVIAPANSWNVIAVGATDSISGHVTSFSSGGPTGSFNLNGTRTKPDIVAPGVSITMPTYAGGGSTTAYATASGTSFASPIVAASAGLLIDMGKATGRSTDPRLVKATLLNSADKLAGWTQSVATYNGTRINYTPLDSAQGSGQVDLTKAYTQYAASSGSAGSGPGVVGLTGWSRDSVSAASTTDNFVFDTTVSHQKQLTATLAWFMDRSVKNYDYTLADPFSSSTLQFTNDRFEDLDLELFNADGGGNPVGAAIAASISGWDPLNPTSAATGLDSVEQLYLTLPTDGKYVLQVRWAQEVFNFASLSQTADYALAWSVVPEPGTLLLLVGGLPFGTMLLGVIRRRRGRV